MLKSQTHVGHVIFITNAHFVKNLHSKWKKGLRYAYAEEIPGLTNPKLGGVWANLRKSLKERMPRP